jgi:SAM-dependent methyltransferase
MSYLTEMAAHGYSPDSIGAFHRAMVPYLASRFGVRPEDPVMDIGAGQGHGLIPLYTRGFRNLVAVDIDANNFPLFREQYGVKCYTCDVATEPLPVDDGSVSMVICFHLLEHLHSPNYYLKELHRVLQPGGGLALVTPDWRKQYRTFYRDPTHIHPYDRESITRLLRIFGFSQVEAHPWGSAWGLGRLQAFRCFPLLGMIGVDLLALARKSP